MRDPAHRVSPRARWMWAASGVAETAVPTVALVLATRVWGWFDLRWWMVAILVAWALGTVLVVPAWSYLVHRWEVTDSAVYTQTGWWTVERRIAPMSRVQTVDYQEGPLGRLFGLASVTVTTASAAGPLKVEGLDRATARGIVDRLTAQADAVPGDAT